MKALIMTRLAICCLTTTLLLPTEGRGEDSPEPIIGKVMTGEDTGSNVDGTNVIVYKEEGVYTPFPSLYVGKDGELVTQFSRRFSRNHVNSEKSTHVRLMSKDGGLSWEEISKGPPVPPLPQWKKENGDLVQVHDEGWIYADASERKKLEAEGHVVRKVNDERIAYMSPNYFVMRSQDQGKTWDREKIRAPDYVRSLYHLFSSHSTVLASNGVRIRALSGGTFENEKSEIFILRSEDDGATWEFVRLQPGGPGEIGFTEPAIVETADHRLLAMMRSVPAGYLWQSFSDDFGKTWTEPKSSGMIGHPAHLLALPDGRLLCTYGYRRHPMGVRASISNDNGKTWEVGSEFVLRADGKHKPADQGYPTTVLLDDGSLFTIYYITLADNNTHIAATKWRLPEKQAAPPKEKIDAE